MSTSANGRHAPTPIWIHPCPVCGNRRILPNHPPKLWAYTCTNCHHNIEVNLGDWRPDTPPAA